MADYANMASRGSVLPRTGRPGGSASVEYRRLLTAYRRRVRRITAPLLLLTIGLAAWGASRTDWLTFTICVLTGATLALYVSIRDEPPQWIENWATGAEGERRTAKVLQTLPAGWHVWHDLGARFGNIDHLVVGPGGVFLMDSKVRPGGKVVFEDRVPVFVKTLDPEVRRAEAQIPRRVSGAAAAQAAALRSRLGRRTWVEPVIVIWADVERPATQTGGVSYVQGPELANWLRGQPTRLTPDQVDTIASALGQT